MGEYGSLWEEFSDLRFVLMLGNLPLLESLPNRLIWIENIIGISIVGGLTQYSTHLWELSSPSSACRPIACYSVVWEIIWHLFSLASRRSLNPFHICGVMIGLDFICLNKPSSGNLKVFGDLIWSFWLLACFSVISAFDIRHFSSTGSERSNLPTSEFFQYFVDLGDSQSA